MNLFELAAKISMDTRDYEKAVKNATQVSKSLKDIMERSATQSETNKNKIKVLASEYSSAKEKVAILTTAFNKAAKEEGVAAERTRQLAKELQEAERETSDLKGSLDDLTKKSKSAGDGFSKLSSALGKGLATAAKIGTAAVGAASTAIVALTTQAVSSFAEYEQLAGGAQKIFNDMDFSRIAADANNAYKELGLSANQYLAVINDVGATFAATMGDEAGYEAAKIGLKAISDYASGTGKNVNELSQKFTLITRSTASYQSIADQFSGILPATSAGFLEQAQAAGILSDSYTQLTEVPIDEYQAAVSQMLEQGVKDLGLYNNTMDEAFSTLSGSLSMAKAAWSNLVTGIADEQADIDTLMGNFIDSVKAVTKQIAPVVGTALNGIGKLIKEVVPVAMQYIPQIIGEFLPTIGEAAIGIVTSIGTAIFDNIDQILEWGQQMLDTLLDGINSNTGNIESVVSQILTTFGSFILENLPEIIMAGLNILGALVSGIVEAIPELATVAAKAIIELAAYLISAENLEKIISLGVDLINALVEGIENFVDELQSVGEDVVESIKEGISNAWNGLVSWFNKLWDSLFKNRSVDVNVNASSSGGGGGSFANGLSYVPYDGFSAVLHKGERVLTADENKAYNSGAPGNTSGITIIQNIQSVPQTPVEFASATEAYFEQARWAFA